MLKRHVSSIIVMVVSIVLTVAIFSILLGVPYCLKYVPIVQYLPKLIYTSDPTAAANMYMVFSALLVAVTLPRNSYQSECVKFKHLLPSLQTPAALNPLTSCAA